MEAKRRKDPKSATRLRDRAENYLREHPLKASKASPREIQRLIHELEVQQIELEMQNEELRKKQEEIEESRIRYVDLYGRSRRQISSPLTFQGNRSKITDDHEPFGE